MTERSGVETSEANYLKLAAEMWERGDKDEIAAVFKLRDEATAAMIRQCCLPDAPNDADVSDWLGKFPANAHFLKAALDRTNQHVVRKGDL